MEDFYVGKCKKIRSQIETDLNNFNNQNISVQKKIQAEEQEKDMWEERRKVFVNSFNQARKCDDGVSLKIQQAVDECRKNPQKGAEFFQKVYCVKIEDLRIHALVDSPFDDKHGRKTDQQYVDDLKDIDPFTWNNNGHPDPIRMFISSEGNYMIPVIESGRHRATAMVQAGGTNYKSVPVNFDCRCPCDNSQAQLLKSEDLRTQIEVYRPNSMIPLICYSRRATSARRDGC